MIKIGICDDEPIVCESIRQKVFVIMKQLKEPCEIICYTGAEELLNSPLDFNILLLDIQMPQLDGMQLAGKLREREVVSALIFITALEERVYDAFEFDAVDYLCKPVDDSRLEKALIRALERIKTYHEKCLFIQTMNWCKSVKISTIFYCEVINRKVYLYTKKGIIEYYCKMEELEKQLDNRFVRCHRSYIVNLDYVRDYKEGQIRLDNEKFVPVSRLRHQDFLKAMLDYMKEGAT